MAIILYSGIPGSGKSYHAITDLIFYAKHGRNIIANFPVNLASYSKSLAKKCNPIYLDNDELTVDYLVEFDYKFHKRNKENQTIVFIDECSVKFNSRDFNSPDRKSWLNFFSQHRKYGFTFILICQNDKQIDKQIRSNIEFEYQHIALKTFNFVGILLSLLLRGQIFIVRKFMYSSFGNAHSKSNRCGFAIKKLSRRKANVYDTFRKFDKNIDVSVGKSESDIIIDNNSNNKEVIENAIHSEPEKQYLLEESTCSYFDYNDLL